MFSAGSLHPLRPPHSQWVHPGVQEARGGPPHRRDSGGGPGAAGPSEEADQPAPTGGHGFHPLRRQVWRHQR